jgi:hypothetical protein
MPNFKENIEEVKKILSPQVENIKVDYYNNVKEEKMEVVEGIYS